MSLDFTFKNLISTVVNKHGLETPNGQPLYLYNIDKNLYQEIKETLINSRENLSANINNTYWCALYCYYCAEWFKREYEGGWSWRDLDQSLGLSISANNRGEIVNSGLAVWNRAVKHYESGDSNYLGSVYSEGGLPLKLITRNEERYLKLFKNIIHWYDDFEDRTELISNHLKRFPDAFKRREIVALVKEMIDAMLGLVVAYELENESQPIKILEQKKPDWLNEFPLTMDAEIGRSFLRKLLNVTTLEQKEKNSRFKVKQIIHSENKNQIKFIVNLGRQLEFDGFKSSKSRNVKIYLVEGNLIEHYLSDGIILNDDFCVKPRKQNHEIIRKLSGSRSWIVVRQDGIKLAEKEISDSELFIGELPIGFKEDNNEWVLCGQGSFKKKADKIRLWLPQNSDIEWFDGQPEESETIITDKVKAITFSGVINVHIGEDKYKISSRENYNPDVKISGKTLDFHTVGDKPVYLGYPDIEGDAVQGANLYINSTNYPSLHAVKKYGNVFVKYKTTDGEVLFSKKITVLPEKTDIKVFPGDNAKQAKIELHTNNKIKRYTVTAKKDVPPKTINLNIKGIKLYLPFPSSGIIAYDKNNKPLPESITFKDLVGSMMILFPKFSKNKYTVSSHEIIIESTVAGNSVYKQSLSINTFKSNEPVYVYLNDFKAKIISLLFSSSKNLDAEVTIKGITDGLMSSQKTFKVKHYDEAKPEVENQIVRFNSEKKATPVLLKLSDINEYQKPLEEIKTQEVSTNQFILPNLKGPHLLIPDKDSELQFRAQFLSGNFSQEETAKSVKTLEKATTLFHPVDNPGVIKSVLRQMAADYDHSGWTYLNDLSSKFDYLPLSTFQVWKDITEIPEAMTMLVMKTPSIYLSELMSRLRIEMNVFWEMVPVRCWRKSYQVIKNKFNDMKVANIILQKNFEICSEEISTFNESFKEYMTDKPEEIYSGQEAEAHHVFKLIDNCGCSKYGDINYCKKIINFIDSGGFGDKKGDLQLILINNFNVNNEKEIFKFFDLLFKRFEIDKDNCTDREREKGITQGLFRKLGDENTYPYNKDLVDRINKWWFEELIEKPLDIKEWIAPPRVGKRHKIRNREVYRKLIFFAPIYSAAIAAGQTDLLDWIKNNPLAQYQLRNAINFDSRWFENAYKHCLQFFMASGA